MNAVDKGELLVVRKLYYELNAYDRNQSLLDYLRDHGQPGQADLLYVLLFIFLSISMIALLKRFKGVPQSVQKVPANKKHSFCKPGCPVSCT